MIITLTAAIAYGMAAYEIIRRARLAYQEGEVLFETGIKPISTVVDINLERSEEVRRWWPFLRDRRIEEYEQLKERYID